MKNDSFAEQYGPWALVTGGTSGLGEAFANQIAEKGINLILVARRADVLKSKSEEIQKRYGVEVRTIQVDLSSPKGYEKVIEATRDLEVGLFIPAAGLENNGIISSIDLARELALIQLNVSSTFALTHHFVCKMAERGKGGVLLIASLAGHMPNPYLSNYAGSKAYVLNFGASLHWEMKKKGVDVTVLSPGYMPTPMVANNGIDYSKLPMSPMSPNKVAELGLDGLGKKALVIPGGKNKMIVFNMKHFAGISMAISSVGKMMEQALASDKL